MGAEVSSRTSAFTRCPTPYFLPLPSLLLTLGANALGLLCRILLRSCITICWWLMVLRHSLQAQSAQYTPEGGAANAPAGRVYNG